MRWERSVLDGALDALCLLPLWVPRGAFVLVELALTALPLGAAWLILDSLGGLK